MVVRRHRSLRCRLGRRKSVENALEAHDMPTSKNKRNLCTYTEKGTPRCCDDARGGYQDRSERTDVDRSCQYDQHNESAGGTSGTVKCDGGTTAMVHLQIGGNAKVQARVQGTVSGLQSEYARARSTGCAESTGDGRQLHEAPHKRRW